MIQNHFTATGIVFNPQGKVLMIKHRKLKVWLPPGGHIDANELPHEACKREVFEETGVTVEVLSASASVGIGHEAHCQELPTPFVILLEDIEKNGTHNHIDMVYICRTTGDDALQQNQQETEGIGWFTPAEVAKLDTFNNVIKSISAASRKIEGAI